MHVVGHYHQIILKKLLHGMGNLIILCLLIGLGMIFIFMVHLSFFLCIPLLIYDVMYDITTLPQGT